MRTLGFIIIILFVGPVDAQTKLPKKISISSGHCVSPCGYDEGFHDIVFDHQLEYCLADSSFRYRKKSSRKFKTINVQPSSSFTETTTYTSLDSLFEIFPDFNPNPGKYFIYRIELQYFTSDTGLPSKTKIIDFWISTDPEILYPTFIDTLITQYQKIIYSNTP